ncbi:DUF4193 domain-containing protein [Corynebacterium sp. S7]
MATDYDAPRRRLDDELETEELEGLKTTEVAGSSMDDEGEIVDSFEIPQSDLAGEELNVTVIPRRDDEFTCSVCFLVQKKSRLAYVENGNPVCLDCE